MYTGEEASRRRGRPRLKKKSIAELECLTATNFGTRNAVIEEEEEDRQVDVERASDMKVGDGRESHEESSGSQNEDINGYDSDSEEDRAKPLGSSIGYADKPSSSGDLLYAAFEWDGETYELEDTVMIAPQGTNENPPVAIIKIIRQAGCGEMFATLRLLYRPNAHIKDDPRWLSYDPRELLFTDHKEEVPVVNIMYKCVVHFLHSSKQLPNRREHPGFVVQHFYDHQKHKVFKFTPDPFCKDYLRKEISCHVRETELRIGNFPEIDSGDMAACPKGFNNNKPFLGHSISMFKIEEEKLSSDKQGLDRQDEQLSSQQRKCKTLTTHAKANFKEILSLYGALRHDARRDIFLERLLEAVHSQWDFITSWNDGVISEYMDIHLKWPDCVIEPVFSLEHEVDFMYEGDIQKYNQKMRQLVFNLKNIPVLAKRFVTRELKPSILLNMSPAELKAGLTVNELPKTDSEGKQEIRMVNAHCPSCSEKKVRLLDVILAGVKQRYQLQCGKCGRAWSASGNEIFI